MQADDPARIFLTVARMVAEHDLHEDIFWQPDLTVTVNCSDIFAWGTADAEPVTDDTDVDALKQAIVDAADAGDVDHAPALYAARKRRMRPQGAAYPRTPRLAALFDACGPRRDLSIHNPKEQPQSTRTLTGEDT